MTGNRDDLPPIVDLAVLTPRQRMVVTLHYFAGWSVAEISAALGIHERATKRLHQRAIARLRAAAMATPEHLEIGA